MMAKVIMPKLNAKQKAMVIDFLRKVGIKRFLKKMPYPGAKEVPGLAAPNVLRIFLVTMGEVIQSMSNAKRKATDDILLTIREVVRFQ